MATTVLGLKTFAASDPVDVNEVNDNYNKIDNGVKVIKDDLSALFEDQNKSKNSINVLTSRMDAFTALPDGSTSGDAELADIRVGSDGKTYSSAGEAVRGQIGNLKDDLADITEEVRTSKNVLADLDAWHTLNTFDSEPVKTSVIKSP